MEAFDWNKISFQNIVLLKDDFIRAIGETAIMMGISVPIGVLCGGLLGIWLFTSSKGQIFENAFINRKLSWVISLMRAFPFVILMIVLMPVTRMIAGTSFGPLAASVSLSIAGSFYFARLVEQNLNDVPKGVIEAAQAMGASPFTIIFKVLLNEARAGLILSVTILIIAILGESAAAGTIGGGGIGNLGINYGYRRYMYDVMAVVVAMLAVLVIVIQALGSFLAAKFDKR